MRSLAAPAAALAFALAGCTQQPTADTGDFSGEEAEVAELVGELSDAASRGEHARVCDEILSARLQRAVAGDESCTGEIEQAFDDSDQAVIDVEEVTIDGEQATAVVSSEQAGERVERTFSFVKDGGDWRIDSFG